MKVLLFKEGLRRKLYFNSLVSSGAVPENARRNYYLATVNATYNVHVLSSNIHYYITAGNYENSFHVDSKNGEVTAKESLDRERTEDLVKLTIYAVDLESSTPQTTSKTVEVRIFNQNDNAPVFMDNKDLEISVSENTSYPTVLATLNAVDGDGDDIR